jgi:hypothetical protein
MKAPWRLVVAVCSILLASAEVGIGSRPDGSSGITFLHLRVTADGFELIEVKTVNGSLRTRRYDSAKPGLHVEVRGADAFPDAPGPRISAGVTVARNRHLEKELGRR